MSDRILYIICAVCFCASFIYMNFQFPHELRGGAFNRLEEMSYRRLEFVQELRKKDAEIEFLGKMILDLQRQGNYVWRDK